MMGAGYEIRRLAPGDARRLVALLRSVDSDFPIPLSEKVSIEGYARKLLSRGLVLAALGDEGELLGVLGGYVNDSKKRTAFLSVLATSANARCRGVGARLVRAFENEARGASMAMVRLTTHGTNLPARRLYESLGYLTDGARDDIGNMTYEKVVIGLSDERPNILLSSAGRRSYLVEWFKRALGGKGRVLVTNSEPDTPAMTVADASAVSPLIYSEEYVPFMLNYCEQNHVGAIIPLFDVDVPVLASYRSKFEAIGCLPVVAPETFARTCSDKLASHDFLQTAGIPQPKTYLGADAFCVAVKRGEVRFPAFVKPRWGMGSIGLAIAENEEELRVLCGMTERKVASSYLRYESAEDLENAVLVQEALDGQEYGMDVVNNLSGRYQGCVVRKKLAMRAGETDVAEVFASGEDSRFEVLARKLSELSHHPGNMDVDVFDVDGKLVVLEMNARFGGGYPFSHAAGVNLPQALVEWLRGGECNSTSIEVKIPGRYMKDISVVRLGG